MLPGIEELLMIPTHYLSGGFSFLLCPDSYRRAVLVGTRYHQHLVTLTAVISGEYVRR